MTDINDGPPREGIRGGLEQFSWDSIKSQVLRDRECYLGQSVRVGVQGKFGRFSRNDWWISKREDNTKIDQEKLFLKKLEKELMEEALGLKPPKFSLVKGELPQNLKEELLQPNSTADDLEKGSKEEEEHFRHQLEKRRSRSRSHENRRSRHHHRRRYHRSSSSRSRERDQRRPRHRHHHREGK